MEQYGAADAVDLRHFESALFRITHSLHQPYRRGGGVVRWSCGRCCIMLTLTKKPLFAWRKSPSSQRAPSIGAIGFA